MHEPTWTYAEHSINSSVLAQRLVQALTVFERLGVRVPTSGRHRAAVNVLSSLRSTVPVDMSDSWYLARIENAHRTAEETVLIAYAAYQRRRKGKPEDLFTKSKLATLLGGPEVPKSHSSGNTPDRDTQFELLLGAKFEIGGVDVRGGEPDLRILYGVEQVGVAAKRVSSTNLVQLERHIKKAAAQIETAGMRGWIALNIDSRFTAVGLRTPHDELLEIFSDKFDSVNQLLRRQFQNHAILGLMLFGYVSQWMPTPTQSDQYALNTANLSRVLRWVDDPAEEILHNDFLNGWEDRLRLRVRLLSSPDFEGDL